MAITVDLSPVILLSRALRMSRFFAALALLGFLVGLMVSPASTWWLAITGAVTIWCINRTPYRLPVFLWISLLCAAGLSAAGWFFWQFAVVLRTAFSPRALGPLAAVFVSAYWLWRALHRFTSDEPVEASRSLFGVEPTLVERWFSSTWGPVLIGGILIVVSWMVFVPTGNQVWACVLSGIGALLAECSIVFLFPTIKATSQRSAHDLLRAIAKSRRAGVRNSYFWFVLGRIARTPKSLGFVLLGAIVLLGWFLLSLFLPKNLPVSVSADIGGAALICLTLCWTRGRQYALKAPNLIDVESEPFTLFLRSFMDDDLTIRRAGPLAQFIMSRYYLFQGASETNPFSRRFEELIAETVWPYAKMVAIGRPGEVLPRLGALRILADPSSEGWHKEVQRLLAAARHVWIAVGISSGLKWEFSQFEAGAGRLKLSLIILPEQGSVGATWRLFAKEYQELLALSQDIERGVALRFCADGAPVLLCARKKSAEAYRIAANACLLPLERFMEVTGLGPTGHHATAS
jgi:hypothetical protein